jgi:hypothetical protein
VGDVVGTDGRNPEGVHEMLGSKAYVEADHPGPHPNDELPNPSIAAHGRNNAICVGFGSEFAVARICHSEGSQRILAGRRPLGVRRRFSDLAR